MQVTRLVQRVVVLTIVLPPVWTGAANRGRAAVVTKRLGTGLPASRSAGILPQARVAPVERAPQIDGKLDEEGWRAASPIVLGKLETHGRTSPRSEVRLLHKDKILYVGAKLSEPNIDRLKRTQREHDGPLDRDDSVELFLWPDPSRGYYQLIISASGAVYDRQGHGDPKAFDCGARAAVEVGRHGWTLEVAVPMGPLGVGDRVSPLGGWRANIYRNRQAGPEGNRQAWSATFSNDYDRPDSFGQLLFTPTSPRAGKEEAEGAPAGIAVHETDRGQAVLAFDLSAVPQGAKVYRARLLCERRPLNRRDADALDEIEIYPLAAPYEEGGPPKTTGRRLALVGPDYRWFEMTELVGGWAAGRGTPGVWVKSFPGWRPEKTYLELVCEGEPQDLPPQVAGVRIFHRAGQTFITFREVDPLITAPEVTWGELKRALANAPDACRYRIYSHTQPIDARTITRAELVAEVRPLSVYNTNGRNKEYLIGRAMIASDEIGELARDWGGYMHKWTMDHPRMDRYPLPRLVIDERAGPLGVGTGLYVHHPSRPGKRYYAAVACRREVENLRDFSGRNAPRSPVDEVVGTGVPVRQGRGLWGPYFDYPGTRWVYVQWCAPPLSPKQNMYFNYSVLIPPKTDGAVPAELYFHPDGYSYAQPGKKLLRGSIQIAPHDYPVSGWYGFNEAWQTLRSPKSAVVGNHTQKRIIAFLDWAKQTLPIDAERIIAVGSDGAAALALNYPQTFAYVVITRFDPQGVLKAEAAGKFAAAWGPKSAEIKDTAGGSNWSWAELDRSVEAAAGKDLPLFACCGASWGGVEGWGKGRGRFYDAMHKAGQPLVAHWAWGGWLHAVQPDQWTGLWRGIDISRNTALPAFSNCSLDQEGEGGGNTNLSFSWTEIKDEPNQFEITITSRECTFDLTLRRLQKFNPGPRQPVRWEATPMPGPQGETADPQSGRAVADEQGVVTIRNLKYPARVSGLVVKVIR